MADNETIADIIAWLRKPTLWRDEIADRLEAAWKREKAAIEADALAAGGLVEVSRATAEKSSTVGDCAKLRKALKAARRTLKLVYENAAEFVQPRLADEIIHTGSAIEDALAAPRRNCDVGTVGEQEARFFAFCKNHDCTANCPVKKKWNFEWGHNPSCGVLFSQMPYEEGGAK